MARPEPPFYVGTTRPGAVGWTRIGMTLLAGVVLVILLLQRPALASVPLVVTVGVLFTAMALWSFLHQWTRFVVDERGLTVSLGGFWARPSWPVGDFRTVQLRDLGDSTVSAAVGGYGLRTGRAFTANTGQLRPVGTRRIFPLGEPRARYRTLVTRSGLLVEIIGREGVHFLISPADPQGTAEAVDQAIRARR